MRWNRIGFTLVTAGIPLAPLLRAQPVPDCAQWSTQDVFGAVTVADVTACLVAGADVMATTDDSLTPLHHAAWLNCELVSRAGGFLTQ
jgi:hypothetical protein